MTWEWYQNKIAEFFRRVPGARVSEDVKVVGKSGIKRQLDAQIFLPMKIDLGNAIQVTVDIHIIVDAKKHERPIDITTIGVVDDLRDDVGAHVAIIASPIGFTQGAISRAPQKSVILLSVTSDLLAMLEKVGLPWGSCCHSYLCEGPSSVVEWEVNSDGSPSSIGRCLQCDAIHYQCRDCGIVYCVLENDEDVPLKCYDCRSVFIVRRDLVNGITYSVHDQLDVMLMTAAFENKSKRIARSRVDKIVSKTKWQYFPEPLISLTEDALMVWSADGEYFSLTAEGIKEVADVIQAAKEAEE